MDIDEALRLDKVDARLIPSEVPDNPWYGVCHDDLKRLCEQSLDTPLNFTFTIGHSVQALILYRSRLVAMNAGMFNAFCRLASTVVGSGTFIAFEGGMEPVWTPDNAATLDPVLPRLSTAMNWTLESSEWRDQHERKVLFMYVLLTLSRFVTLHEIGHVYHRHGDRFNNSGCEFIEVDAANPNLLPLDQSLPSQAREILADNFAFLRLRRVMFAELEAKSSHPVAALLREKLLGDSAMITRFLLHMTHLYFHMMDRQDWSHVDYQRLSHPPAPFRQQNLYTLTLENGIEGLTTEQTNTFLADTHFASEALAAVVHDQYPAFLIRNIHSQSQFTALYTQIHQHLPDWCRE